MEILPRHSSQISILLAFIIHHKTAPEWFQPCQYSGAQIKCNKWWNVTSAIKGIRLLKCILFRGIFPPHWLHLCFTLQANIWHFNLQRPDTQAMKCDTWCADGCLKLNLLHVICCRFNLHEIKIGKTMGGGIRWMSILSTSINKASNRQGSSPEMVSLWRQLFCTLVGMVTIINTGNVLKVDYRT